MLLISEGTLCIIQCQGIFTYYHHNSGKIRSKITSIDEGIIIKEFFFFTTFDIDTFKPVKNLILVTNNKVCKFDLLLLKWIIDHSYPVFSLIIIKLCDNASTYKNE